jgi:hypothetical protein
MKYCSKCGNASNNEDLFCAKCGKPFNESNTTSNTYKSPFNFDISDDTINSLLLILGIFIPLAGFILYLAYRDSDPAKANSSGKGALIGVGASVGLAIVSFIIFALFFLADVALGSIIFSIFS